jgi:DNA-binding IclR family transcriptional regulator
MAASLHRRRVGPGGGAVASEPWHVVRTLRALEMLALAPRSVPELAAGLQVHDRTARGILKRLESEGYVTFSGHGRRYRPTMRIVALAGQVVDRAELAQTAVPYVMALRNELGEGACHLVRAQLPLRALPRPRPGSPR